VRDRIIPDIIGSIIIHFNPDSSGESDNDCESNDRHYSSTRNEDRDLEIA
jgi:hypothetical protein